MALTWDLTKCADVEAVKGTDEDNEWSVTESLIWATMYTGIGDISEKNAPEFYARIKVIEKMHGPLCSLGDGESLITPEAVAKRIGMQTNVFPMETRAKWLKRWFTSDLNERVREFENRTP